MRSQDLAGNYSDWATSTLYVDNDPPSFVRCPGDIAVTALPGAMMASVTWIEPTATDTIPGPILVGASHAPGDAFPIGTTTVSYTATDTAGHTAICSFDGPDTAPEASNAASSNEADTWLARSAAASLPEARHFTSAGT